MSHTYHLLCVDCREVLDLGKVVNLSEDAEPIPWTAGGWRDQATGEWLKGAELWNLVERFLILHRGHELRNVPESFLDSVDPEGSLNYIDSAAEVFERTLDPEPDDFADAARIDPTLAKKLGK